MGGVGSAREFFFEVLRLADESIEDLPSYHLPVCSLHLRYSIPFRFTVTSTTGAG